MTTRPSFGLLFVFSILMTGGCARDTIELSDLSDAGADSSSHEDGIGTLDLGSMDASTDANVVRDAGSDAPTLDASLNMDAAIDLGTDLGADAGHLDASFVLGASSFAAGYAHTCAIVGDSTRCWGNNGNGQLGAASSDTCDLRFSSAPCSRLPLTVASITAAASLTAGFAHTCALDTSGQIHCWGKNAMGQLGNGDTTEHVTPVNVTALPTAVSVVAGDNHNCAVLEDGTVRCWGLNRYGQIGVETEETCAWEGTGPATACVREAVAVPGLTDITQVALGSDHTCALHEDGTVSCWGNNSNGQLGWGALYTHSITPTLVVGVSNAIQLVASTNHTCARLSDGTARCWGKNTFGQLGDGTPYDRYRAVAVSGLVNAMELVTGIGHSCALITDGTLQCWGDNNFSAIGPGDDSICLDGGSSAHDCRLYPATIAAATDVQRVIVGGSHTCILHSTGSIACWAGNEWAQLGRGATSTSRFYASIAPVVGIP